jgi:hypothetical protein
MQHRDVCAAQIEIVLVASRNVQPRGDILGDLAQILRRAHSLAVAVHWSFGECGNRKHSRSTRHRKK